MSDRLNPFWDLFESADDSKRECKRCGSDNVKYATHSLKVTGVDASVQCKSCGFSESAISPNFEHLFTNWHNSTRT